MSPEVTGQNEDDSVFLIAHGHTWMRSDLEQAVESWKRAQTAQKLTGKVVAVPGEYTLSALAFLVYAWHENTFTVASLNWEENVRASLLASLRPDVVWQGEAGNWTGWQVERERKQNPLIRKLAGEAGLLLATTGTTGERKWVLHRLRLLTDRYQNKKAVPVRVLPLMSPSHIGGQDIFWRAWFAGATIVVPESWTPEGVGEAVEQHAVSFLAATPSYLRGLWLRGIFDRYDWRSVKRVTYGGEPMPAALLDQLKKSLPWVLWEQRYGLSELSTFSTREAGDGYLWISPSSHSWKVVEGELWVRRPASWLGYLSDGQLQEEEWFSTGDRVEQREDGALRILGRKGLFINVGGGKVSPEEVESVLYALPGVQECRVYPRVDSLMGQVVGVDLVVPEARRAENWRLEVRKWCRERLPQAAIPVHVQVLAADASQWQAKQDRRSGDPEVS